MAKHRASYVYGFLGRPAGRELRCMGVVPLLCARLARFETNARTNFIVEESSTILLNFDFCLAIYHGPLHGSRQLCYALLEDKTSTIQRQRGGGSKAS
jgi:hypothetical protein